ncbi:MAG: hypothetical protein Q8O14_02030 [bacterium]|jgi:hypothetical protein|nr:hypothetical protein [bacterium]
MSLIDSSRVEWAFARLAGLEDGRRPRWGRLTALGMVEHLANSLEIAMGLRQAKPLAPHFLQILLRPVALLPWPIPPGLPSTVDFLAARGEPFPAALDGLRGLLRRFHREVLADPTARHGHPVFGSLTRLQWAALQDRHLRHHFRQFGL